MFESYVAATVELGGVLLQWDRVIQPYAHLIVQYRPVSNLTATLTYNDSATPWSMLDTVALSIPSMLVPASDLVGGSYFEFRIGYLSGIHTALSNPQTILAMVYTATSLIVTSVVSTSTESSLSLSWHAPAYSDNVIGYDVSIFSSGLGNAAEPTGAWNVSNSQLVASARVALTATLYAYGCANSTVDCLTAFTTYLVQISVIRTTGQDAPFPLYVATQPTIPLLDLQLQSVSVQSTQVTVCASGLTSYFGSIILLQLLVTPVSTTNPVIVQLREPALVNFTDFSYFNTSSACNDMTLSLGIIPQTTYNLSLRAWTSAGAGPFSDALEITTPQTNSPDATYAPTIRTLYPAELLALGWGFGYLVSWLYPIGLRRSDFARFDVMDDGLPAASDIVYSGANSSIPLRMIYGAVHVRTVTLDEIGPWSTGSSIANMTAIANSSVPSSLSTSSTIVLVVFVAFGTCLVVAVTALLLRRHRDKRRREAEVAEIKRHIPAPILAVLEQFNGGVFKVPRAISPLYLTFLDTLGEGKFGAVMKALLDEQDQTGVPGYLVAVKMAKDEASEQQVDDLRLEAAIMAQFNHPNVLGLIGQVSEENMFLLVAQYCEHGSLLRWVTDNGSKASLRTLFNMCLDTCEGMVYLESLGVVHRDLAARNVLVSSDFTCKIADFGFARQSADGVISSSGKDQVAVRWAALEAISDGKYTSKSDVWSYGVLLYEVFSFGCKPYAEWSNQRVLEELHKGSRLERPLVCPEDLYALMMRMWHADPALRPSFDEVSDELEAMSVVYHEAAHESAASRNPLLERFNETKKRKAQTSGNDSGADNVSVSSANAAHHSSMERVTLGSVGKASARRSSHSVVGSVLSAKMSKKGKRSRTIDILTPQVFRRKSVPHQFGHTGDKPPSSYVDLLGKDDLVIRSEQTIAVVPPVFTGEIKDISSINEVGSSFQQHHAPSSTRLIKTSSAEMPSLRLIGELHL